MPRSLNNYRTFTTYRRIVGAASYDKKLTRVLLNINFIAILAASYDVAIEVRLASTLVPLGVKIDIG